MLCLLSLLATLLLNSTTLALCALHCSCKSTLCPGSSACWVLEWLLLLLLLLAQSLRSSGDASLQGTPPA